MSKREDYLKREIQRIKLGGTMSTMCVMSTPDRVGTGLCNGVIPEDRSHRGLPTCSPDCQNDRRRLQRWEKSKKQCRLCGHGLTKAERQRQLEKAKSGE